jgi:uncharacterized protein
MSADELRKMFGHIANFYRGAGQRMDFVWHGGEPLLAKAAYYQRIRALQEETLGAAGIAFTNSVQTNLTVMNDEVLDLLEHFFTYVGCSIDLFGDQRVNVAGKPMQNLVLRNMQVLLDRGIRFGCIVVLSQETLRHVEQIYHFFEDVDISFRLLPIYRTGYEHQQDLLAVSDSEIVDAFKVATDLWFASDRNIQVRPIQDYIVNVVRRLSGDSTRRRFYNKVANEVVYIVDTDGSLFSNADAYDQQFRYGNLFEQSLTDMHESDGYRRAVQSSDDRMAQTCSKCKFHGACSGYFMAEATPEQRYLDADGRFRCAVAQPLQNYIEALLGEAGLVDFALERLRVKTSQWEPLSLNFAG